RLTMRGPATPHVPVFSFSSPAALPHPHSFPTRRSSDLLQQPTFVMDHPLVISPLARKHRSREGLVERFEPVVMGMEIGNAFSELNDPLDQRERFEEQLARRDEGDDEAHHLEDRKSVV